MSEAKSKTELARILGVSRSSLYYRPKRPVADEELRRAIEAVMLKHPGYGHRRVGDELGLNRKRVRRVMRKFNLKPARRCKTPEKPADRGKEACPYPDIVSAVSPISPGFIWVSDFTFISYKGRFVYLATIIDLFTKEVLGVSLMIRHTAELVMEAFNEAVKNVKGAAPVWFHTDQGSEYDSNDMLSLLQRHGVNVSMTPKSSPWRNGSQESFFGRFKVEFARALKLRQPILSNFGT